MAIFRSLSGERSRRIFLALFTLSSLLPLLVMVFIAHQYLLPALADSGDDDLRSILTFGLAVMLVLPLLGLVLMARWVRSLESLTREIRAKSTQVIERNTGFAEQKIDPDALHQPAQAGAAPPEEENEIQSLVRSFNAIFQTAADQITEREHLKELLASLIAVASDLTSELEFERLFPLIIHRVTAVMDTERTTLYVIDWEKRELWTKVAEGIEAIRVPMGHGISGRVAETGESLNVADAWDLPYFDRSFDERNHYRTRSVLCVPVRSRSGRNIGVLQVINKLGQQRFENRDEAFLKGLASQVGIALENSLLIDEIKLSFTSSVSTLSAMVDARHPLTAGHSRRVTEYALLIAREMNFDRVEIEILRLAALLHDIGKIGIRDAILLKEDHLTDGEKAEMNSHPVKTRQILDKFHFPPSLLGVPEIAGCHHERVDGSGYPEGLRGDRIPLAAKVISVADVFDALTSRREYPKYADQAMLEKDPMSLETVVDFFAREAGTHFAPEVVAAFMRCLPRCLLLYRGEHFPPEYVDPLLRRLAPETPPEMPGAPPSAGHTPADSQTS